MKENEYAIVLAGGGSRRMGQDKALLLHEGQTFLERMIAVLLTLTPNILVVADRADKYALDAERIAVDLYPDAGPVGGIVTGLLEAGSGLHYVVACDMPTINADVLRLLYGQIGQGEDAAVPYLNGEPEPLYAVYRHTAAPKLQAYLEAGRRSARGALNALNVKRVDENAINRVDPGAASFANINTPSELARFQAAMPLPQTKQDLER